MLAQWLLLIEIQSNRQVKVALEGYRRCPDSHDLGECHHLYDLVIKAAPGCQKSCPSYNIWVQSMKI